MEVVEGIPMSNDELLRDDFLPGSGQVWLLGKQYIHPAEVAESVYQEWRGRPLEEPEGASIVNVILGNKGDQFHVQDPNSLREIQFSDGKPLIVQLKYLTRHTWLLLWFRIFRNSAICGGCAAV